MRNYVFLTFFLLLWSPAALAQGLAPDPVDPALASGSAEDPGFLRGEELRYQNANVFLRVLADIPALPTAPVDWSGGDWAVAGAVLGSSAVLMFPLDPTPDVRLDDLVTEHVDPWMPDIWGTAFQAPLWMTIAAGSGATWAFSAMRGHDDIAESMSLAGESVAAFQVYHLTLKLAFGRADDGRFYGFPTSVSLFPKGTPGGHFGTMYALYGALETYWNPPVAFRVGMHALLATFAFTHFLNHRHFLSDQILGASLGYAISKWVVRHRSSRFTYDDEGDPTRIVVVPMGRGLALRVDF